MEKILDDISQPSWWVSVLIVGFVVNLLSAYAKPLIDKILSKYFSRYRQRVKERERSRNLILEEAVSNDVAYIDIRIDSIIYLALCLSTFFLVIWLAEAVVNSIVIMIDTGRISSIIYVIGAVLWLIFLLVSTLRLFSSFANCHRLSIRARNMRIRKKKDGEKTIDANE